MVNARLRAVEASRQAVQVSRRPVEEQAISRGKASQRAVEAIRQAVDFFRMHTEDTGNAICMIVARAVRNQQRRYGDSRGENRSSMRVTTSISHTCSLSTIFSPSLFEPSQYIAMDHVAHEL